VDRELLRASSASRLARVLGATITGLQGRRVLVEVDLAASLPGFTLVGLPSAALRESRERVGAALRHSGFHWPNERITVSLAPADLRKDGAALDLAIAVGVLLASEQVPRPPRERLRRTVFVGELALDGALRPSRGLMILALDAAELGIEVLVAPAAQALELQRLTGTTTLGLENLRGLKRLMQTLSAGPTPAGAPAAPPKLAAPKGPVFSDIRGQSQAKRAVLLAAAGGHHLHLQGPPGCGKTLLARRMVDLLPPLDRAAWRERLRICSVSQGDVDAHLARRPPFRAPHHSVSVGGLVGGGRPPRPGEVTLAHHGVLFLDEATQFGADRLDLLREPLSSGEIVLSRVGETMRLPARFQLVAASNPCPCGWWGSRLDRCRCLPHELARYRRRMSGPLRDRIDIWVYMDREPAGELWKAEHGREAGLRAQVRVARGRGQLRGGVNGTLDGDSLLAACALDEPARAYAEALADRMGLSHRAMTSILRVARTIADIAERDAVSRADLAEAFGYRALS
jgi:magnesium chelatase family protein